MAVIFCPGKWQRRKLFPLLETVLKVACPVGLLACPTEVQAGQAGHEDTKNMKKSLQKLSVFAPLWLKLGLLKRLPKGRNLKANKNVLLPLVVFIGITALFLNRSAQAQDDQSSEFKSTLNYAFATQLGSGIYRGSGRTVQIYRLSVSIKLLSSEKRGWGLWLRLPVTLGFYNFQVKDVLVSGLPDNISTLALVPALEFYIPARKNWRLGPFGGLGVGRDFSNGITNYIYAAGIKSMAIFLWRSFDVRLGNRLVYSGYTTRSLSFEDDFAVFETGLDFRRPIGIRIGPYHLDGSVFGANYLYFVSPNVIQLKPDPSKMQAEWETGITFGTVEQLKLLGIGMPRVGISYRFIPGSNAIRIIIGNPFPIDSPRDQSPEVN